MGECPLVEATLRISGIEPNEGSRRLESRRRAGQTGVALPSDAQTCDLMHSQRQGALKRQLIKSSFSRDAKNCLTNYVRNYSVRSARGTRGKPIRVESWGTHLNWKRDRGKNYVITHDIATIFRSPFGSGLIDQHSPA